MRVTTDFSVQKSVDRNAKNVRLNIHINERKRHHGRVRGQHQHVVVGAARRADAAVARFVRRLRGGRQRRRHPALLPAARATSSRASTGGASGCRPTKSASSTSIDEGPELRVRGIEFVGNASLPSKELAGVVSVRKWPSGWGWARAVTSPGGRWSGTPSASSSTTTAKASWRSRRAPRRPRRAEALGAARRCGGGGRDRRRATRARSTCATPSKKGRSCWSVSKTSAPTTAARCPTTKNFLYESVSLQPGDPYTPAAVRDDSRRLERLARRRRLSVEHRRPRGDPHRQRRRAGVGVQARPARAPSARCSCAATSSPSPRRSWNRSRWDRAALLTTTDAERGQRNLGFLQLFNNASPISFPGREDKREVVPMVVEVEERNDQYSIVHLGVGASDRPEAADPVVDSAQ